MSDIPDEKVAKARRMRHGKTPYSWEQIAAHLAVPMLDLIRRCDRTIARNLGILHPGPISKSRTNFHEVIDLHKQHPDWDSNQIAAALGCLASYVRTTARRQGLTLPVRLRQKYRLSANGDEARIGALGFKDQLVEDFYNAFDEVFADRAVFECQPKLCEEFKTASKKGQTLSGFLLGDPLPERSALAQKKANL